MKKLNQRNEKMDNYFDLAKELKDPWNMRVTGLFIAILVGEFGTVSKGPEKKKTGRVRNLWKNQDSPGYCIIAIYNNT